MYLKSKLFQDNSFNACEVFKEKKKVCILADFTKNCSGIVHR